MPTMLVILTKLTKRSMIQRNCQNLKRVVHSRTDQAWSRTINVKKIKKNKKKRRKTPPKKPKQRKHKWDMLSLSVRATNITRMHLCISSLIDCTDMSHFLRFEYCIIYICLKATMGGSGIRGHWTSVETNSKLSKIFPEPPMVAFKQPSSLRNLLGRTEISKPNTTIGKSHSLWRQTLQMLQTYATLVIVYQ
jgi:hypothetical protein